MGIVPRAPRFERDWGPVRPNAFVRALPHLPLAKGWASFCWWSALTYANAIEEVPVCPGLYVLGSVPQRELDRFVRPRYLGYSKSVRHRLSVYTLNTERMRTKEPLCASQIGIELNARNDLAFASLRLRSALEAERWENLLLRE